jgi:hypothetical protein
MLVVSHDAGGAEIVSSWLRRHPQGNCRFIVDGPAAGIFRRKFGKLRIERLQDMERLIEESSAVLTGTSWASDLEKLAIKLAKKHQVKVVSFLDSWVNYLERFQLEGEQILPDEIWVGDKYALEIAEGTFEKITIKLIDNPYLLDIRDEIESLKSKSNTVEGNLNILYVCEPVSDHAYKSRGREDAFGFTEFEAMALFISHLRKIANSDKKVNVRIRPHPSEPSNKYDSYININSGQTTVSKSCDTTLVEDCAWSHWVVGINSMALVVALLAGKDVFCCIPGHSRPFGLPHAEIRNFLELSKAD